MTAQKKRHLPFSKRLRYGLETALAYLVYGVFWIMPLDVASAAGGALLGFIGPYMGLSRVAYNNLSLAMPEKTQAEKEEILRGMWNNLGRVIGEYPHLHRIHGRVEVIGRDFVKTRPEANEATIFVGAHIGNWEINAISASAMGIPLHVVYRKPNNPWVDSLLVHARRSGAQGHIPKGHAGARAILSHLRKKGALGILIDQKLNEGIPVPFFGYDAMTADAVAQFALSLDCPLHGAHIERLNGANFRMTVSPALVIERTGDKKADALKIMTEINQMVEGWIRERPEQWLWIHRRWPKTPRKSAGNQPK